MIYNDSHTVGAHLQHAHKTADVRLNVDAIRLAVSHALRIMADEQWLAVCLSPSRVSAASAAMAA